MNQHREQVGNEGVLNVHNNFVCLSSTQRQRRRNNGEENYYDIKEGKVCEVKKEEKFATKMRKENFISQHQENFMK